jgi:hypothetical protein
MRQTPDAANLIAIARQTLLDTLLPALPADKRYAGLMVANALAIAGRQLAEPPIDDRTTVAMAMPELASDMSAGDALDALVQTIRSGRFDEDPAPLFTALEVFATDRAGVSAPKALKKD